ncbi:hypothetical protein RFM41_13125 [Mesorhizobium sp. VK25A]|uniref:Uncharacterized protein n=1 Tax=Mesorhizobium vachelliae TaxID=3072309 RepID=A0ABU5A568_9HYPH|nr:MULTISPECIES: hypothetical protein [unclassified Mesorhizobium]MDX8532808.1 hypothetical protein [Mesorhizobium sp. VK25D]MDX8544686.1 hypothetical protein [Mesorhizobium sp. VK25A]
MQTTKIINTQQGLIEWLGEQAKNSKRQGFVPKAVVEQFDEMIKAFAETGFWQFDGAEDEFFEQLHDRIDRDEMGAHCHKSVPEFVAAMGVLLGEEREAGEIGVPCIAAVIQLLKFVAKQKKVLFCLEGEDAVRVKSKQGFERHHGVSIDVVISLADDSVLH